MATQLRLCDLRFHCRIVRQALLCVLISYAILSAPKHLDAQEASISRCEIIPLPGQRVSLSIDGIEKVGWHFGKSYERPFFYPLRGVGNSTLTRVGHPGAENHDHHRSIWFAHQNVAGVNFWSNNSAARVRQKYWYRYGDGQKEAIMAVRLGWYDDQNTEVMDSDVVAAIRPLANGELAFELQLNCRVPDNRESVQLGKTNFGFLAVRVAKSVSVHFGDGKITNSEGNVGEKNVFGKRARWMDYSGSVPVGQGPGRTSSTEGITYFDHPQNPRYPTHWHVREDGWMGASFCMHQGHEIQPTDELTLRYLLHVHSGGYDAKNAERIAREFAKSARFVIKNSTKPHLQYDVSRQRRQ